MLKNYNGASSSNAKEKCKLKYLNLLHTISVSKKDSSFTLNAYKWLCGAVDH